MAKVDWELNEVVTAEKLNALGEEINDIVAEINSATPYVAPLASGLLLDEAITIVQQTATSTPVAVTGSQVDFTVIDRPVIVELYCPYLMTSSINAGIKVDIIDSTSAVKATSYIYPYRTNVPFQCIVKERITTPGNYSRLAQFGRQGSSGTITNGQNNTATPLILSVIEQ